MNEFDVNIQKTTETVTNKQISEHKKAVSRGYGSELGKILFYFLLATSLILKSISSEIALSATAPVTPDP